MTYTEPSQRSEEKLLATRISGIPMLLLAIVVTLTPVGAIVGATINADAGNEGAAIAFGIAIPILVFATVLLWRGLILVNPNQSKVVLLFGKYIGSIREAGFYWINPFTIRREVSLRVHNFTSETLKVNDLRGNPIEIGAVVVWRVKDSAQAAFDVENYTDYVEVQSEAAIRTTAAKHPYDSADEGETSLRGDADEVNVELQRQLTERLDLAGIDVLEVRLAHLAYASEIAGAMLRRQQAEAIIDARSRIVDGAVGMVKMALDHLQKDSVVDLDEERKASMVSNLLVVLCSEHDATPVLNTGTLHS